MRKAVANATLAVSQNANHPIPMSAKEGFIYIFTGDGKGKTTAALGQALRAHGQGWRVLIIQFIKKKLSGEVAPLGKLGIEIFPMGVGFVGIGDDREPSAGHRRAAREALAFARGKAEESKLDLLILDEINVAVDLNLLGEEEVLQFLKEKPQGLTVILTGWRAPKSFIEIADLVTEMKEIKHPFTKGKKSRRGLEY